MSETAASYQCRQPATKHLVVGPDVHQQIRLRAVQDNVPIRDVVERAIKEFFERQDQAAS